MIKSILSLFSPARRAALTQHSLVRFQQYRMTEAKMGASKELRNRLAMACRASYLGLAEVLPANNGKWRIRYGNDQFITTSHPMNWKDKEFKLVTCYPNA